MALSHPLPTLSMPIVSAAPVLVTSGLDAVWLGPEGEITPIDGKEAAPRIMITSAAAYHAPSTAFALGNSRYQAYHLKPRRRR